MISGDVLPENVDFFNAIRTLTEVTIYLLMLPLKWHRKFQSKPYVRTMEAWGKIFTLSKIYVTEKLRELSQRAVRGEAVNDGSFIAFLMIQDKLSPEEIYSNMTELLTASVDTTSTTTLWCLHLLSKNPHVQEKLHEEVMRVLPEDVNPTRDQINNMPYLKAVIKETLRLFPITQGTARVLPKDLIIRNYHIPAGTAVQTFFYGSGNDTSIFEHAAEFKPERWLDGSCKNLGFASQPFGFGTRMCLGRRLAEQEMYLIMSQISRRFIIEPTKDNIDHVCKVLIIPDQPLELKFIDRK
ncbi:cytochrome P450 27C1-like [Amphiura filiformis]|uniref:cytochrome P450 27C1-like n=1 Tax=Amphiura filiformis TaxID=82378 RepID=UPI003B21D8FD